MKKIIIPIAFLLSGCFSTIMDDDYSNIDSNLLPYVESFINEAKIRGIDIYPDNLKVNFGCLNGEAEGRTLYETSSIIIDSSSNAWKSGMREQLVFHELGHLLLNRGHDNNFYESKPFNICKSIMSSNDSPYYEKKYSFRREYYINELFNPNEPKPSWISDF